MLAIAGVIAYPVLMAYPGGKSGGGLAQLIAGMVPPCSLFVEAFAGGWSVGRLLADRVPVVLIDRDRAAAVMPAQDRVVAAAEGGSAVGGRVSWIVGDGVSLLSSMRLPSTAVVYCDPPYLFSVRRQGERPLYRREFGRDEDHLKLLSCLRNLSCRVIISGYRSELYDDMLWDWRRVDHRVRGRRGWNNECVWLNYPAPSVLLNPLFAGLGRQRRQDSRRLVARRVAQFLGLSVAMRMEMLARYRAASQSGSGVGSEAGVSAGIEKGAEPPATDRER